MCKCSTGKCWSPGRRGRSLQLVLAWVAFANGMTCYALTCYDMLCYAMLSWAPAPRWRGLGRAATVEGLYIYI